ncbi:hypothetical protein INR49_030173 [Caranx melampygus]|nr:hypothetical protein INR49_030173 [Caranx melampygus]
MGTSQRSKGVANRVFLSSLQGIQLSLSSIHLLLHPPAKFVTYCGNQRCTDGVLTDGAVSALTFRQRGPSYPLAFKPPHSSYSNDLLVMAQRATEVTQRLHKQQQLHHWRTNHPGSSRTLRKSQGPLVLGCAALLKEGGGKEKGGGEGGVGMDNRQAANSITSSLQQPAPNARQPGGTDVQDVQQAGLPVNHDLFPVRVLQGKGQKLKRLEKWQNHE